MAFEEDKLLQSGFAAITKAFDMKSGNTKHLIQEQENLISDFKERIVYLESENEQLKTSISHLQIDNQRLVKENNKLSLHIEENKRKLQMIKASIIDSSSPLLYPIESNNNNEQYHYNKSNSININHTPLRNKSISNNTHNSNNNELSKTPKRLKENVFQLYKKKITSGNAHGPVSNNCYLTHRSNKSDTLPLSVPLKQKDNEREIDNESKYSHIETKINKIRGNLSSREPSIYNEKIENYFLGNSPYYDIENNDKDEGKDKESCRKNSIEIINPHITPVRHKKDANTNKINQYGLTNNFLNECNLQLNPKNFEKILSIFQLIKEDTINQEIAIEKIKNLLQNNTSLLNLLSSLFPAH